MKHLHVRVKESISEHRLWVHLYFSKSVLVRLILMIFEIGGRWPYICCFVECCAQYLCSSRLAFSLYALSASMWCIFRVEWIQPLLGRNYLFILSDKSDFHMIDNLSIAIYAFARRIYIYIYIYIYITSLKLLKSSHKLQ